MESKKFLLQEKDIPTAWYNIVADMENKPLPPLNPKTKEPLKPEDLYPLFAKGLVDQVFSTNIAFSYNLPHWQIGMEYMPTTAWYGDTDKAFGRP